MTEAIPLRHLGRAVLRAEGKDLDRWRVSGGRSVRDLSGGPLLQSLVGGTTPPRSAYAAIGASGGLETPLRERAERELMHRSGPRCGGVLWASSGSDAMELALWAVAGDAPEVSYVVLEGGYHGATALLRQLSTRSSDEREPRGMRTVVLRDPWGDLNELSATLDSLPRNSRPVVVLETVPTTGVVFWPGPQAFRRLLEECAKRDVPVVLDEVASGGFRHGWFSAFEWLQDCTPEAVVLGKALTGGRYPLSAALLNKGCAERIRAHGNRPPSFTHGLSDVAAWWFLSSLEQYNLLEVRRGRADRAQALKILVSGLRAVIGSRCNVQSTCSTLRLGVSEREVAEVITAGLERRQLDPYRAVACLQGRRHWFFLACPPFDLPVSEVIQAFEEFSDVVVRSVSGEVGDEDRVRS